MKFRNHVNLKEAQCLFSIWRWNMDCDALSRQETGVGIVQGCFLRTKSECSRWERKRQIREMEDRDWMEQPQSLPITLTVTINSMVIIFYLFMLNLYCFKIILIYIIVNWTLLNLLQRGIKSRRFKVASFIVFAINTSRISYFAILPICTKFFNIFLVC